MSCPRSFHTSFIVLGLLAVASLSSPHLQAADTRKLNVVLILADDLGQRDLRCYGSKFYQTPNIDQLASEGMRFTDFYAACPVCSPTRASLMTGQYPARLNLTDWLPGRPDRPDQRLSRPQIVDHLPANVPTLPQLFKAAGYVTGTIGKWHLGGVGNEPQTYGFDVNIAGDSTGTPMSYFAPFRGKGRTMPGLEQYQGGEYLTDCLGLEASKFLEANKSKPFFLYLPHFAVHTPLRAKKEMIAKYQVTPKAGSQSNPVYAAMVESFDEAVGKVLATLKSLKLKEDTLVILTSDNGGLATTEGGPTGATINSPLREGKGFLYEGGTRVPLIVRWPGVVKPASVTPEVACSIDVLPTLVEACGLKSDAKPDGVSLIPVLKGGKLSTRAVYWHYPHYANQGGKPGGSIRMGDYKLIEFFEDGRRELFDVRKDLSESRNLVAEKPEIARDLHERLEAWRKDVNAKPMTPYEGYVPNPQARDGSITLHSKTAIVAGIQLRFEPLPHKNTLGFWTKADDYATFEFTLEKPGMYDVNILHGCGKGSGGSEVEIAVGDAKVPFTVKETGGFQMFEECNVGTLKLDKPGRHTLTVKAKSKPGPAVMDLRQIVLTPAK